MSTIAQANKFVRSDSFQKLCERRAKRYLELLNIAKPLLLRKHSIKSVIGTASLDESDGRIYYTRRKSESGYDIEINISKDIYEDAMEVMVEVFKKRGRNERKVNQPQQSLGTISFNYYKTAGMTGKVTDLDTSDFSRLKLLENRLRRLKKSLSLSLSSVKPDFGIFRTDEEKDYLAENENDPEWLKELKAAYKNYQALEEEVVREQQAKRKFEKKKGKELDAFLAIEDPKEKEKVSLLNTGIRSYEISCQHIRNCRNAQESIMLNEINFNHTGEAPCTGDFIKKEDELQCVDCGLMIGKEDIGEELFNFLLKSIITKGSTVKTPNNARLIKTYDAKK